MGLYYAKGQCVPSDKDMLLSGSEYPGRGKGFGGRTAQCIGRDLQGL